MNPPRPHRKQPASAWGAGNIVSAQARESEARADGFEFIGHRNAEAACLLLDVKELRAFARDVPFIAVDPDDNSLHAPGEMRLWAPPAFKGLIVVVRTCILKVPLAEVGPALREQARTFILRVMRDDVLQQALAAAHSIGGDDVVQDVLHNILRGEPDADAPDPEAPEA